MSEPYSVYDARRVREMQAEAIANGFDVDPGAREMRRYATSLEFARRPRVEIADVLRLSAYGATVVVVVVFVLHLALTAWAR